MNWIKNYKEIVDGWINDAFPTKEVLAISEPRAEICAKCPLNINNICSKNIKGMVTKTFKYKEELRYSGKEYSGCGCPLSKKTKSIDSQCPLNKW